MLLYTFQSLNSQYVKNNIFKNLLCVALREQGLNFQVSIKKDLLRIY